jgi:chromosomal replication initiation ATPase DnaA
MTEHTITAALIQAVAGQSDDVEVILEALDESQLRQLALELAGRLCESPVESGPDWVCAEATRLAAQAFGVSPEAVVAKNRHRPVADARAVAQAVARESGLTLPAIARYFGQHHASVMHSLEKVSASPRLRVAADRIAAHVADHYVDGAA